MSKPLPPTGPALKPLVPSPGIVDTSAGATSSNQGSAIDSLAVKSAGGRGLETGGRGLETGGLKNISPSEEGCGLKPKRQAPPRPPVKGGAGDQTDSSDLSDGSQHREGVVNEGVVNEGVAKEDAGNVEGPNWKRELRSQVVTKATVQTKVVPKVGRVALPGMVPSGEKKLEQEKQVSTSCIYGYGMHNTYVYV